MEIANACGMILLLMAPLPLLFGFPTAHDAEAPYHPLKHGTIRSEEHICSFSPEFDTRGECGPHNRVATLQNSLACVMWHNQNVGHCSCLMDGKRQPLAVATLMT
jgi:hypothetical protein